MFSIYPHSPVKSRLHETRWRWHSASVIGYTGHMALRSAARAAALVLA